MLEQYHDYRCMCGFESSFGYELMNSINVFEQCFLLQLAQAMKTTKHFLTKPPGTSGTHGSELRCICKRRKDEKIQNLFPIIFGSQNTFQQKNCKKLAPLFKHFLKRFPLSIFGHKVRYTFYWTNEHVLDCCKHFLPLPINRNIAKGTT